MKRTKKQRLEVAQRLAVIRGDRSQREFARELGVFQQNVNRYERGTAPHMDFLRVLVEKENVNLNWLVTGTGPMRVRKR